MRSLYPCDISKSVQRLVLQPVRQEKTGGIGNIRIAAGVAQRDNPTPVELHFLDNP
jgi:hypothetical protein